MRSVRIVFFSPRLLLRTLLHVFRCNVSFGEEDVIIIDQFILVFWPSCILVFLLRPRYSICTLFCLLVVILLFICYLAPPFPLRRPPCMKILVPASLLFVCILLEHGKTIFSKNFSYHNFQQLACCSRRKETNSIYIINNNRFVTVQSPLILTWKQQTGRPSSFA